MGRNGHNYYWACAVESTSGRPMVFGPHSTDVDAREVALRHSGEGEFEIYRFPTINKFAARDMYRKKLEEQGTRLVDLFKRAKYKTGGKNAY
jgi:hypothetical protein